MAEFYIAKDNTEDLSHYGIIGMRWGIRRYQNPDGTYTDAGLKRYFQDTHSRRETRAEIKADNKKAFEIGKKATIYGKAYEKANRASTIQNERLAKAQESGDVKKIASAQKKADMAQKVTDTMRKNYEDLVKAGEDHVKELIEKYGEENVKGLNYREVKKKQNGVPDKLVDEKTVSGKDIAVSAGASAAASALLSLAGVPAMAIYAPKTAAQRANDAIRETKKQVKKEQKQADKEAKRALMNNTEYKSPVSMEEVSYTKDGKFTDSYKKSALQKAKESNVYNMNFLEAVQNKSYGQYNKTPEERKMMLSEYERFLNEGVLDYEPRGKDV